jgi:hypothetical protein
MGEMCGLVAASVALNVLFLSALAVLVAAPITLWIGVDAVTGTCNAKTDGIIEGARTVDLMHCSLNVTTRRTSSASA